MTEIMRQFRERILCNFCLHLIIVYVLGCLVEGRPRTLKRCGRRDSHMGRIVGGEDVQPGEYPWQVSVQLYSFETGNYEHIFGGSILNEHYIAIAAHCIEYKEKLWMYAIYTGLHRLSEKTSKHVKKYEVSQIIMHKDYNKTDYVNDIALLRTKEPITFQNTSGYVNGICLPKSDDYPTGWAIASGWGKRIEGSQINSDVLQAVKVPLVPGEECVEAYENSTLHVHLQYHICAGMTGRDACQADSGGPLMKKGRRGIHTLIGIVSFGHGCGRLKYPGVYTKVAYYMDWLEENMD